MPEDHVHNFELIHSVFPEYAQQLPSTTTWQGRASIRAQSLDYFPLVGKMQENSRIATFAGLGSKGFLFAPLCSEILVAQMLGEACPVPDRLLQKLNPQRFQKKVKPKKALFQTTIVQFHKKAPEGAFFYAPCSRGKPASRAARVPPISTTYSREASNPSSVSAARGALLPPPHKI